MVRSIILALALALSVAVTPGSAPTSMAVGGTLGWFSTVSCVTSTFCMAMGGAGAAQWDGSRWTFPATASPSDGTWVSLANVSCPTLTFCMAVGSSGTIGSAANPPDPVAEAWNGTTWAWLTLPQVPGAQGVMVQSVSCTSSANCVAVGAFTRTSPWTPDLLALRWDGTQWALLPTPPLPRRGIEGSFGGVSCTTDTSCIAVGEYQRPSTPPCGERAICGPALAERWDGTRWTILPTSATGSLKQASLESISCNSATSCVAVGSYPPLAERWNGKRWTVQRPATSPPNQGQWTTVSGVACSGARHCIAVGRHDNGAGGATWAVVEQWNGTTWTVMSIPHPHQGDDFLSSIACTASNRCVAVGGSGRARPKELVERWDGTLWTMQQPAP